MLVPGCLWAPILLDTWKCPLSLGGMSVSPNQEDAAWFGCAVAQWDGQQEEGIGFVPSLGPTNTTCFRVCSTNSPCGSEITVPALAAAF